MASKRYEADDLIGSLATKFRSPRHPAVIVTRDKDLAQLLKPGDTLWDFADDRRIGLEDVATVFGVGAAQIADFLAIAGDAVDNIPGVPGIGKKTAQHLLMHFGSLDVLYQNLHEVSGLSFRGAARAHGLLEQHRELALLSQALTRIKCDIDLKLTRKDMRWQPDVKRARRFFKQLGFGARLSGRFDRILEAGT
jgi:5'-3' exonuclease